MMENGEDAAAASPAPPVHVDPDRIVGIGTEVAEDLADPSATPDDASVAGRIALARDTSVRVAKDVGQSVSKTVGDTVKTIDDKYHVAEKANATRTAIGGTVTSVTTKTTEVGQSATAKLQPKIEGTRQSLLGAAKGVGASVRNLDDKLRVSATVSKVAAAASGAGKDATGSDASDGNDSGADATNPMTILRAEGTVAKTLTVSDQHVTILLTHTVPPDGSEKANGGGDELSISYREEDAWSATANDDEKAGETVAETAAQVLPKTVKSLLKLTVVPFHRQVFDSTMPTAAGSDSAAAAAAAAVEYSSFSALNESDERNSREILAFLADHYNFDLTSFSGAEYSYWTARPGGRALSFIGDIAKPIGDLIGKLGKKKGGTDDAAAAEPSESSSKQNVVRTKAGSFTVEFISPASERQIQRASPSPKTVLIEETPELYDAVVKPHIEAIIAGGSLSWVKNVVDGTKEAERLIFSSPNDDFIVNVDTKWRSHPDPNTTPREEWLHHSSTADLYCLGIFKADGVACMRDLRAEHLSTLKSMVNEGISAIERTYGIPRDQIRCYCHYQPQFMHFHVHYTRLENEIGCQVERGHLISDIIQNLEMDPEYYSKRTITYKLRVTDELYRKIDDYQQQQQGGAESDAGL